MVILQTADSPLSLGRASRNHEVLCPHGQPATWTRAAGSIDRVTERRIDQTRPALCPRGVVLAEQTDE